MHRSPPRDTAANGLTLVVSATPGITAVMARAAAIRWPLPALSYQTLIGLSP